MGRHPTVDSPSWNYRLIVWMRKRWLQDMETFEVLEKANPRVPKYIPFQGMPPRKPRQAQEQRRCPVKSSPQAPSAFTAKPCPLMPQSGVGAVSRSIPSRPSRFEPRTMCPRVPG